MHDGLECAQAHVLALSGQLDVYRSEDIRAALQAASGCERLVIDLGEVPWIGAAALSEFIRVHKYRSKLGLEAIRFVVRSPAVRAVFEITGLTGLWQLFENARSAAAP